MLIIYPDWWYDWVEYDSNGEIKGLKEGATEDMRQEFEKIRKMKQEYRERRGIFSD